MRFRSPGLKRFVVVKLEAVVAVVVAAVVVAVAATVVATELATDVAIDVAIDVATEVTATEVIASPTMVSVFETGLSEGNSSNSSIDASLKGMKSQRSAPVVFVTKHTTVDGELNKGTGR